MEPRPRTNPPPVDPTVHSDAVLLGRIAAGELGALGALYDRYHEPVRHFLARATFDAEDVDDLTQSTFLSAAKCAARYDGRDSCRPWLIGIAAQLLRRRQRRAGRLFGVLSLLGGAPPTRPDAQLALQTRSDLERALAQLSELKRITFLMASVEGMTCPEIADALGVPVGTVWTRLHAARRELRGALSEGEDA